jgi:hypothetical protein
VHLCTAQTVPVQPLAEILERAETNHRQQFEPRRQTVEEFREPFLETFEIGYE